jgi:hypothetical protein
VYPWRQGAALAYVYFEDETGRRMAMGRLTWDEACGSRRISRKLLADFELHHLQAQGCIG